MEVKSTEAKPKPRVDRKTALLLALVLGMGTVLRLAGITWSLPDTRHPITSYHPDELVNLGASQQADLAHGKFDIGFYNYGAFYFYLVNLADTIGHGYGAIPTSAIEETRKISEEEMQRLQMRERAGDLLAGRLVTALMGIATIPVLFALGLRLYNSRAGLLGALFYALAPLATVHAHFLTVDVPATFFVSLALLSAAKLLEQGTLREAILAGIWCGLAAATKYTAVVSIVAPLAALTMSAARTGQAERAVALRKGGVKACVLLLATVVVFLIACPGPWLNWKVFWEGTYPGSGVRYELFDHARTGHEFLFVKTDPGWWYALSVSLRYGLGLPLLLLSAAGCAYALRQRAPADLLLLAFVAVAYAATCFSAVRFARYQLPITPALCLLAARLAVEPFTRRITAQIALAAGALTAAACVLTTGGLVRAMTLEDPRDRAADYLAVKAQPHSTLAFAHIPWFYSPPLSPLWGSLRWEQRAVAAPALPNLEFRVPDGNWDLRVLNPPPDFLILSNIETGTEWKRLRMPAAVAFMKAIPATAQQTTFKPGWALGLSPEDQDMPQDLLYILPEITIYETRR